MTGTGMFGVEPSACVVPICLKALPCQEENRRASKVRNRGLVLVVSCRRPRNIATGLQ